MNKKIFICFTFFIFLFTSQLIYAQSLTLDALLSLLKEHNPTFDSANASKSSAEGGLLAAQAYPNPEIEAAGGMSTGLGQGALSGTNEQLFISQSLDLPFVREARAQVAQAGIESAEYGAQAVWLEICAKTKQAFYQILRRQMALQIAQENEQLLSQIRDKVKLKVEMGEAARYEEVKAFAELLNATKLRESAEIDVKDAKSALRALFVDALPENFEITGQLPTPTQVLELNALKAQVLEKHPLLRQQISNVEQAKEQVNFEEMQRYPVPILKAGVERDPGLEQWKIGMSIPIPIWNQRQGLISQAKGNLEQQKAKSRQQTLDLLRELENAYNRYVIANKQVEAFEKGLLAQAEKTLHVAQVAYKLGERGILDYLDAQRVFRSVKSDYLNARFERQNAWIDLQKLNADDLLQQD